MSKRAIILAGGLGTRLKPYTVVFPKPLMPIGNYPIVEVVIRQLVYHGFDHITLAVNHQAEIIQAFFIDGSKWGVKIDYSVEDKPLSTMGPLKLINDLPEDFLIMNGDILTDLDFSGFYQDHVRKNNIFTIASYQREQKCEFGVLKVNGSKKLSGFKEKPVTKFLVSMGIYMANKKILDIIPDNSAYGFDQLMLELIKVKNPAAIEHHKGYWLDIGNPEDYSEAVDIFEKYHSHFIKSR